MTSIENIPPSLRFPQNRTTLKPSEVAEKLGRTKKYIIQLCELGKIPHRLLLPAGSSSLYAIPIESYYTFVRECMDREPSGPRSQKPSTTRKPTRRKAKPSTRR